MNYLDFDIEISAVQQMAGFDRPYLVKVVSSPAGEVEGVMEFPFDQTALQLQLSELRNALLLSSGTFRRSITPGEKVIQSFGETLFNAVFTDRILSCYDLSRREVRHLENTGLRLKLRIQPPELAQLPWEFLYDSSDGKYISLSMDTPVVRYLPLRQPIEPLTVAPPLRILGMVASPTDQQPLDIAAEKSRVEQAVGSLRPGQIELHWLEGQTAEELRETVRRGPWHIFHFVGHGGFDRARDEGYIELADEQGSTRRLYASDLVTLLDHRPLRVVFLNACEGAQGGSRDIVSSTASILVRSGIPAVVAMQYVITDLAAIRFAKAFYEAIAEPLPLGTAVVEARKAISVELGDSMEWGVPVVYTHSPDGLLFNMAAPASRSTADNASTTADPSATLLSAEAGGQQEELVRTPPDQASHLSSMLPGFPSPRAPASPVPVVRPVPQISQPTLLRSLTGHSKQVNAVAFSPDGSMLATAAGGILSEAMPLRLWNVADGSMLRALEGHTNSVSSVVFSADSTWLVSASHDGTVRLWSAVDGSHLQTLIHGGLVYGVALTPDNQILASGSDTRTVRLWRVDGLPLHTLPHDGTVNGVAFSPDGALLASASDDRLVRLWQVADGGLARVFKGHNDCVTGVAFSPDGTLLASSSQDRTARLWQVANGELLQTMPHDNLANGVAFSPDGTLLVSASRDRLVRLWRAPGCALLHTLKGHTAGVKGVTFSSDGTLLASASDDRTVHIWQLK